MINEGGGALRWLAGEGYSHDKIFINNELQESAGGIDDDLGWMAVGDFFQVFGE